MFKFIEGLPEDVVAIEGATMILREEPNNTRDHSRHSSF